MLFKLPTMYSMSKGDKIKQWDVSAEDGIITVTHGYTDGKKQSKVTVCKGKNKGRKNETTAEVQAEREAQSKWNKQYDKCYRETIDAAISVGELLPMLASDYTKVGHRIKFPCEVSPKLDGVRGIADVTEGGVSLTSRGGKPYPVMEHLQKQINLLSSLSGEERFDGEIYMHGVSLQNIVSAVKKPNENSPNLQYWIFDLPSYANDWSFRTKKMRELLDIVKKNHEKFPHIHIVESFEVKDEDEARQHMDTFIATGYEGVMLRNFNGIYEHNHRSGDLQKWKDFYDSEAKTISCSKDLNGQGKFLMEWKNPKGCVVQFDLSMNGNQKDNSYENLSKRVGEWVTFKYQGLTDEGKPTFNRGLYFRECDSKGNPVV